MAGQRAEIAPRSVVRLPLTELWTADGAVTGSRNRSLSVGDIKILLRAGPVRFVVADLGFKLQWIAAADSRRFWKEDVQPHLAPPDSRIELNDFPDAYCYFASEWSRDIGGPSLVLCEKYH
jgi:hypothetical protein